MHQREGRHDCSNGRIIVGQRCTGGSGRRNACRHCTRLGISLLTGLSTRFTTRFTFIGIRIVYTLAGAALAC
jgi:hypothetical protein